LPVTLTSKPSARGNRPSVVFTASRRSGTTVRLRSVMLEAVSAAIKNVVRRSELTKVDSPIVRTETTWLM
jgi:hypothetical protein